MQHAVCYPHLTQSYQDGPKDNDSDAIPMCTLRNFPSEPAHCIEWSLAQFNDTFVTTATEAQNFIAEPRKWLETLKEKTIHLKGANAGRIASAVAQALGPARGFWPC